MTPGAIDEPVRDPPAIGRGDGAAFGRRVEGERDHRSVQLADDRRRRRVSAMRTVGAGAHAPARSGHSISSRSDPVERFPIEIAGVVRMAQPIAIDVIDRTARTVDNGAPGRRSATSPRRRRRGRAQWRAPAWSSPRRAALRSQTTLPAGRSRPRRSPAASMAGEVERFADSSPRQSRRRATTLGACAARRSLSWSRSMAASSNSRLAAASRICCSRAAIAAARCAGSCRSGGRHRALLAALVGALGALVGDVGREAHLVERLDDRHRRDVVLDVVGALDLAAAAHLGERALHRAGHPVGVEDGACRSRCARRARRSGSASGRCEGILPGRRRESRPATPRAGRAPRAAG